MGRSCRKPGVLLPALVMASVQSRCRVRPLPSPSNCATRSNTGTLRLPAATSARQSICLKVDIRLDWRTRMTPASPSSGCWTPGALTQSRTLGPGAVSERKVSTAAESAKQA